MARPRHYNSPEEFDEMVDDFLNHCKESGNPITWTGLALHLGFAGRRCIDEYEKYDGFSHSVKRAKSLIENAYEKGLVTGNIPAAGAIFALKNFQWKDKQEIDLTSREEVTPWGEVKTDE